MSSCSICGEPLPAGARTCAVCGTGLTDVIVPTASIVAPSESKEKTEVQTVPVVPPGGRFCPSCRSVYGPEYSDSFCTCGVELLDAPPPPPPPLYPQATETPVPLLPLKARPARPTAGTP